MEDDARQPERNEGGVTGWTKRSVTPSVALGRSCPQASLFRVQKVRKMPKISQDQGLCPRTPGSTPCCYQCALRAAAARRGPSGLGICGQVIRARRLLWGIRPPHITHLDLANRTYGNQDDEQLLFNSEMKDPYSTMGTLEGWQELSRLIEPHALAVLSFAASVSLHGIWIGIPC